MSSWWMDSSQMNSPKPVCSCKIWNHHNVCNIAIIILPHRPWQIALKTMSKLRSVFREKTSLSNIRYNYFKIAEKPENEIVSYASCLSKERERFQLKSRTTSLKHWFLSWLTCPSDAEFRTRPLAKLDSAEYLKIMNVKHDSKMSQHHTTGK